MMSMLWALSHLSLVSNWNAWQQVPVVKTLTVCCPVECLVSWPPFMSRMWCFFWHRTESETPCDWCICQWGLFCCCSICVRVNEHFVVVAFFLFGIIYVIADSFINLHHPRTHTFTLHFSRMHNLQSLTLTSFVAQLMSTLTILRPCFLEGTYCLIVTLS